MPSKFYYSPEDAQQSLQDGDLLLFEGRRVFSFFIKLLTRSKYSHVALFVWIDFNDGIGRRAFVLEAMEGVGVRLYPFGRYMRECARRRETVHWYTLACEWENKINRQSVVAFAANKIGLRYAPWYQFVIGASWLVKHIRAACGRPMTITGEWFHCSRLALQALVCGGYDSEETKTMPVGFVDPGWVARRSCLKQVGVIQ